MSLLYDAEIRERIIRSENPFQHVIDIAILARKKAKESEYHILDSEALTWVIQGIEPVEDSTLNLSRTITNYEEKYLDDMLCCIDDAQVRNALQESFYQSKSANKLIYEYGNITDKPRQTRVRILLRMIWYNTVLKEI